MKDEVVIRFRLIGDEAVALRKWSAEELRNPRDQLRHILRQELNQRGLLPSDGDQTGEQGQRAADG